MSGNNFLIPALKKLCNTTSRIYDNEMQTVRTHLCKILENRFSDTFHSMDGNPRGPAPGTNMQLEDDDDDDENDDESMPVVISTEEVEASSARSSQSPSKASRAAPTMEAFPPSIRNKYPVLFAAKLDHEVDKVYFVLRLRSRMGILPGFVYIMIKLTTVSQCFFLFM